MWAGSVFPNWMQLKTPRTCVQDQLLPSCPSKNISWFSFSHSLQKSRPCLVCQITLNIPYLKYPLNGVSARLPTGVWFTYDPKATAKNSFSLQDPANHSHSLILCDSLPFEKLNYPPFLGCQSSHLICLMSWLCWHWKMNKHSEDSVEYWASQQPEPPPGYQALEDKRRKWSLPEPQRLT